MNEIPYNYQFWNETGTEFMTLCRYHTKKYVYDLTGDQKFDPESDTDVQSVTDMFKTSEPCSFCSTQEQLNS